MRKFAYILFSLVALVCGMATYASAQNESAEMQRCLDGARRTFNQNPDSALVYANRLLELSRAAGADSFQAEALGCLGALDQRKGAFRAALAKHKTILELANKLPGARRAKARYTAYSDIGKDFYYLDELDSSLYYLRNARDIAVLANVDESIGSAYNDMGNIFSRRSEMDSALAYYQKAADMYRENKMDIRLAPVYNNMAKIYVDLTQRSKARYYADLGLAVVDTTRRPDVYGDLLTSKAAAAESKTELAEATEYLKRALAVNRKIGDLNGQAVALFDLSMNYVKLEQYDAALRAAREGLEIARKMEEPYVVLQLTDQTAWAEYKAGFPARGAQLYDSVLSRMLTGLDFADERNLLSRAAQVYAANKEFKKAWKTSWRLAHRIDAVRDGELSQRLAEMEARYETRESKLRLEKEQVKARHLEEIIFWGALAAGFILLLAVALGWLYARYRARNRLLKVRNREIARKSEEIELQAEEINQTNDRLSENNRKLLELSKFKEGLTYMLVHDLKNPLGVLLGYLDRPKFEAQREPMRAAANQMLNLTMNMLDVQRFESASVQLNLEDAPLTKPAARAVEQVQFMFQEKRLDFRLELQERAGARLDVEHVSRILINLLNNAAKFAPQGGKVRLSGGADGETAWLEVWNEGPSIPEDKLEAVFEKFGKLDDAQGRNRKGTGIGLSFCKMAAEAHGGAIQAFSPPEGGARFRVELPAVALPETTDADVLPDLSGLPPEGGAPDAPSAFQLSNEDCEALAPLVAELRQYEIYESSEMADALDLAPAGVSEEAAAWLEAAERAVFALDAVAFRRLLAAADEGAGARQIVVADGDEANRAALANALSAAGYLAVPARNATEAAERIAEAPPALALLDWDAAALEAPALLKALRAAPETRWTPVVLIAADAAAVGRQIDAAEYERLLAPPVSPEQALKAAAEYAGRAPAAERV